MKVALVIERMDPSRGGRETSTAQIASHLVRRGCDVTIVCLQNAWSCDGVEVRRIPRRGVFRSQRLGNFIADAASVVAGGGFDVVHATLPVPGANVYQPRGGTIPGQLAASRRRRGIFARVSTAFEPLNRGRRMLAELERALVRDEKVWCLPVSEMVAGELRDDLGRTRNVRVVYNAVDVPAADDEQRADWRQEVRYRLGAGVDDPIFITVAKNFPLKGVSETIRAFERWHHAHPQRNGRLVVVGRENPEGYQRIAGLRGVGKGTVFVPPTREIFRWYAAADVCALLSWYDPCSRVVLEAARWGIPSITTVYNGAAEILAANGGAIVVSSPRDIAATAAAMAELADPRARAARSQACLAVADSLSMERHVDELLEVYEQVKGQA